MQNAESALSWRSAYQAVIEEHRPTQLLPLVDKAERAIFHRAIVLASTKGTHQFERKQLKDAVRLLCDMKLTLLQAMIDGDPVRKIEKIQAIRETVRVIG